jgi:uncharacterized Zn-binding protein involved in type VI secretion
MALAARVTDMHVCPAVTGAVPHVGGPIVCGCMTVLIGGLIAARVGDQAVCQGAPADVILEGCPSVLIGGQPAARINDPTAHGGAILVGCPTVTIG